MQRIVVKAKHFEMSKAVRLIFFYFIGSQFFNFDMGRKS